MMGRDNKNKNLFVEEERGSIAENIMGLNGEGEEKERCKKSA